MGDNMTAEERLANWQQRWDLVHRLRNEEHKTLQQIGDVLGVTRERIRQILAKPRPEKYGRGEGKVTKQSVMVPVHKALDLAIRELGGVESGEAVVAVEVLSRHQQRLKKLSKNLPRKKERA